MSSLARRGLVGLLLPSSVGGTDRLSRFSKIGGEVGPHIKVEETGSRLLGGKPSAVTLFLILTNARASGSLCFTLNRTSQVKNCRPVSPSPNYRNCGPKRENLHFVDEIPVPGSGKTDLKNIRTIALRMVWPPRSR